MIRHTHFATAGPINTDYYPRLLIIFSTVLHQHSVSTESSVEHPSHTITIAEDFHMTDAAANSVNNMDITHGNDLDSDKAPNDCSGGLENV